VDPAASAGSTEDVFADASVDAVVICSPGFEDGTAALILADAAAESAATGKPVTVEGARQ
jgi:predicted dehydrogenase